MRMYLLIALGMVLGASLATVPFYMMGRKDGAAIEAKKALEVSVAADNNRRKIDAKVSSLNNPDVCRVIGLPDHQIAECMRRVAEANARSGQR